jgi:hypothetical protein
MEIPNYIAALLQPQTQKPTGRKVWSIDLETVWLPFFHATNVAGFGQIGHRVRSMVNTVSGHREHHLGAWWPGVGAERRRACVSLAYDPVSLQIHLLSFQSCTFTAASAFCAWTRP